MAGVSNSSMEHDAKTRGIILHIVEQIKSQGVFDRFRRDCLEELDSKEPYRQLKQRVESHVATFLSKQMFSPNLPKNQLRTSLRTNINQSEVLSKGVDRLLEQVLVEKSGSFYKEIENLVEEHLISTGHYKRDKPQGQPKSELTKFSDKEIEEIIKEETNRLLEASADEKSQESDGNPDSPPPGTSGEMVQVEKLISTTNESVTTSQMSASSSNVDATLKHSEGVELVSSSKVLESNLEGKGEKNQQVPLSSVSNIANESSPYPALGGQEVAQMSEYRHTTETSENIQSVITTESNPESMSGVHVSDASVDVSNAPSASKQDKDDLQCEQYEVAMEVKSLEDYKPAADRDHIASTTTGQKTTAVIPNESSSSIKDAVVVSQLPKSGNKPTESKPEVQKTNVPVGKRRAEIKKTKVSTAEVNNPEEVKKTDAEVVKRDALKPKVVATVPNVSKTKSNRLEEKSKVTVAEKKTVPLPKLFSSTEEGTDEDLEVATTKDPEGKSGKSKFETQEDSLADLSDSDITVSSVHTSDLSSLEDSMSDMEFEDYQELAQKKKCEEQKSGKVKISGSVTSRSVEGKDESKVIASSSVGTDVESGEKRTSADSKKIESTEGSMEVRPGEAASGKKGENAETGTSESTISEDVGVGSSSDISKRIGNLGEHAEVGSSEVIMGHDVEGKKLSVSASVIGNNKKSGSSATTRREESDQHNSSESSTTKASEVAEHDDFSLDSSTKTDNKDISRESSANLTTSKDGMNEKKTAGETTRMKIDSTERKSGQSETIACGEINNQEKSDESSAAAFDVKRGESGELKSNATASETFDSSVTEESIKHKDATTIGCGQESSSNSLQKMERKQEDDFTKSSSSAEGESQASSKDEESFSSQKTTSSFSEPSEMLEPVVPTDSQDSESSNARATDAASEADNEAAAEDTDSGNHKLSRRRFSRRISIEQESVSSSDTITSPTEQTAQRRSARVASKDKKDDSPPERYESKRLRHKRSSQEKLQGGSRSKEEKNRAEKRQRRQISDSNGSDTKPSKRSKRVVRPTRCYSPSENS